MFANLRRKKQAKNIIGNYCFTISFGMIEYAMLCKFMAEHGSMCHINAWFD